MPDFAKIYIFRMTHILNIPHMMGNGITHISSANRNPDYKPIGDGSLINSRADFDIPNGRKLGEYIPFYFGVRMPMLYVIQKGFNGVPVIHPRDIVYCFCTLESILKNNLHFVFSDGHAIDRLSTIYYPDDINNIDTIIDIKAIKSKYWKDEEDLDLKRRKEAEFLIASDIPADMIGGYIVYNSAAKATLVSYGVDEKQVYIKQDYYF